MRLKRYSFTLVELIVSMAVFALLSMMVVQLFSASQKLWVSNNQKSEISAEGRLALDLISNLLMSATANPKYDTFRVGSDYFKLAQDGISTDPDNPNATTSRLYFVTKSDLQALVGGASTSPACFVGVQVVQVGGNDDPDKDHYVLVVGAKTSMNSADYAVRFPDNTYSTGESLEAFFDGEKDQTFGNIVSNTSHKVSRIATNVVDFQVRAVTGTNAFSNVSGTNNSVITVNDVKPIAVEIELTLMDRRHYEDLIANPGERSKLIDQFGRTFRRVIWLDGSHRSVDISRDWEL